MSEISVTVMVTGYLVVGLMTAVVIGVLALLREETPDDAFMLASAGGALWFLIPFLLPIPGAIRK